MDDPGTRAGMVADANELFARLTFPIAFEQDAKLRASLRRFAALSDQESMIVQLPISEAWLRIDPGQEPTVHRAAPEHVPHVRVEAAVDSSPRFCEVLSSAIARTKALQQARQLLAPLFDAAVMPTRQQMRTLLRWAPALEHVAYKYSTRATSLADRLRPDILADLGRSSPVQNARLMQYWNCTHSMGHMTLLASTPGSGSWLVDMADSFVWINWTPTFPLLRERTLWLATLAARSALAFGEPVVEKYLSTLSLATHAMRSFDAVFGLVAIALDQDRIVDTVIAELVKQRGILARHEVPHAAYTNLILKAGIQTLREPNRTQRELLSYLHAGEEYEELGLVGLLTAAGLRSDPVDVLPSGAYIGLAALPMIVAMPAESYYPIETPADANASIAPREIGAVIQRSWAPNSTISAPHSYH